MKSRSLIERLGSFKDTLRKSLKHTFYMPLALAAALSFTSPVQAQTSITETFTGNVAERAYVEEHADKWDIKSEQIEALDFGEEDQQQMGLTKRITNDQLYDFAGSNLCVEADASVSQWFSDTESLMIILASGSEIGKNGTFYMFQANWRPIQGLSNPLLWRVVKQSPGLGETLGGGIIENIPGSDIRRMKVCKVNGGYECSLDGKVITTIGLQDFVGYIGVGREDLEGDPKVRSTAYFDNLTVTSGGAGGVRIQKALGGKGGGLEAHIPEKFIRGDSNMDRSLDISDGINTLNYLFLGGGNGQCPDAMDINDSGDVDLSDAVKTFNILFTGDQYLIPPPAYKNEGNDLRWGLADIDLTKDSLGCKGYRD